MGGIGRLRQSYFMRAFSSIDLTPAIKALRLKLARVNAAIASLEAFAEGELQARHDLHHDTALPEGPSAGIGGCGSRVAVKDYKKAGLTNVDEHRRAPSKNI
jgi:hypothetical protein